MAPKEKEAIDITAGDEPKKDEEKSKNKKKKSTDDLVLDALSEEDRELKERLETCVSTVVNEKKETSVTIPIRLQALDMIVTELKTATSSMTSVPKPLKFLRPHFLTLKATHKNLAKQHSGGPADVLELRARLADVLAILAMTFGGANNKTSTTSGDGKKGDGKDADVVVDDDIDDVDDIDNERESLNYKLDSLHCYDDLKKRGLPLPKAAEEDHLGSWGHEFVRSLAGEIGQEYQQRILDGADPNQPDKQADDEEKEDATMETGEDGEPKKKKRKKKTYLNDLIDMVNVIVPFHLTHNAEAEAIDLLIEVQRLKCLLDLPNIDENNYQRICLYLIKTADYMSDPDDLVEMLETAYEIFKKQEQYFDALRVALRMNRGNDVVQELLKLCHKDKIMRKQMCILLGRHRINIEIEDGDLDIENGEDGGENKEGEDANDDDDDDEIEKLNELIGNEKLSEQFLKLAQDLDVMDPKTPEDIYKSHLAENSGSYSSSTRRHRDAGGAQVDSARANLASTFVNAFVNAGFGQDKLMTPDNEWLYKNKDHGMMSAAASLGSILLWNVEEGLTQIDKFLYSNEEYVKAGAALAVGILSSGVRNDADPALALLTEHVEGDSHIMKCAACTGLGIAYAGTAREDVMEILVPIVEATGTPGLNNNSLMMEVSLAGLALGMIFVGKCDDTVGGTIVQRLMESSDDDLNHTHARFLCLGLALLFLGQMEKAEAMIEAVRTIEHKISKYACTMLESAAYAGSGNVLKIQQMLHECAEHLTEDAEHQMAAVIGLGLIAVGEDVGAEMTLRTYDHLLHYCELPIKRAVPLSMAALHISNPDYAVIDQLSRLSHDPDTEISQNAILALGIVSSGTNNSRVAGLLRQLSEFYNKEAGHIFCVRIAQGLLHMGKGLMTLNPYHSDRMLLNGPALGGMMVLLHSCLDLKSTLLDKSHYLLYYLTCAMNPRMLITLDEELNWRPVTVRVGQAVETVGQAGKPKRITGFQTHTTPVLLATTDRAELATEEVIAKCNNVLEGLVILQDNPDYEDENGGNK